MTINMQIDIQIVVHPEKWINDKELMAGISNNMDESQNVTLSEGSMSQSINTA